MMAFGRSLWLLLPIMSAGFVFVSMASAELVTDWVTVGPPGNVADTEVMTCCAGSVGTSGYGAVSYGYRIGRFEVTNAEYSEFLNAVAATDTFSLYNTNMETGFDFGGIARSGSPGSFTYSTIAGRETWPVNFVSFWDATRFANWLHNGQPTGAQDNTTTEDGAYSLTPSGIANNTITRNLIATVFVLTEDEWYKAAYYKGGGKNAGFWDYPAKKNATTTCTVPTALANTANCSAAVLDPTGTGGYTSSASPSGTFDQGGNVWEWNEAMIGGSKRGMRGGGFIDSRFEPRASNRVDAVPTLESESVGFRVGSYIPEFPFVPSLGLLGGVLLLALLSATAFWRLRALPST